MDRYIRHLQLDGFGPQCQQSLSQASVLIVGAGALGTVCGMYLAAAGVGSIHVADFDSIDITNLQRQLAFTEADLGKPKAETLAGKMRAINSQISATVHSGRFAEDMLKGIDLLVEASDNPATKYIATDIAEASGIPYVFGGVAQWRGQVMCWAPGHRGYRHIFPEAADSYTSAAKGGVFSPLPGIIASIQAAEAIKIIAGTGTPLFDSLLMLDSRTMSFSKIEF